MKVNGFTIVELLITTSIVGIISGLSLASFFKTLENERLRSGSRMLASWIDDQRNKAMQYATPCDIQFNTSTATAESTCDFNSSVNEIFNLRSELSNGGQKLNVDLVPASANPWTFSPRGTAGETAALIITLKDNTSVPGQCIQLLAPLGLVRTGRLTDNTNVNTCDFKSLY